MKEYLLKTLENSRSYTLSVAEAMPENFYNSKPAEAIWNFRELMHHIAYGIGWWENNYIKKLETEWNPPAAKSNKQQVIEYLKLAYDSLKNTVHKGNITEEIIKGFHATTDHITHHRGQAVIYLRCKDIVPPEYSF